MLCHLHISNFAIVRALEIDWASGMSTITGETGAGKSIAIDALSLCLGERADASVVRPGADKADIVASFDISKLKAAQQWLTEQDLAMGHECIVRRVVNSEGRSRGYINGVQVPAQQLKALGQHLLSIHGQHAHQQLLKSDYQRQLLDAFAANSATLDATRHAWRNWQQLQREYSELQQSQQQRDAQRQLLEYQVAELDNFAPQENEYPELEAEHSRLSHGNTLLSQSQQCLQLLYDDEQQNIYQALSVATAQLEQLATLDPALNNIAQMLNDALVQTEEASRELRRYADKVELDPERLAQVDERLGLWLNLSRKHQVAHETLPALHQQLAAQLATLTGNDKRLVQLTADIEQAELNYMAQAEQLSEQRRQAASALSSQVSKSMHELSMANARFEIQLTTMAAGQASANGIDAVEFQVSTNPGQPLQAMHKVASGGELSRISLAIQVILADKVTTPTLIFDEVDVGISGPVAAGVGRLLRQLGESTQIICVTHLPQVASQGHQQLFVEKYTDGIATETRMRSLTDEERISEIARLLAGENISASALANARELLCAPAV
ncbi:DNA repair protein RecN (Recombination protein N) [Rheinheimera pacifica]|uniref:DNA repair protein RecN n=1 Tax=Rheinheimera pacifica TaxID=173990 RepID=UPI00216A3A38|nr:DNA repair protein RecN [Rheinheimera pacifica]MCS4307065.1 DNA repair protein RecN (Recombination protein N) [Rheinheimera pacifica]